MGQGAVLINGSNSSNSYRAVRVDNNGDLQVDLASAIPAGTNLIGKVQTDDNSNVQVLASAARTSAPADAVMTNGKAKGLHLVIDVTAIGAAPSITVTIKGKDAISGKLYTILASAAITTVSTTVLKVYPGLTAAANSVANDVMPVDWVVSVTHANGDSITYSIGSNLIR